MIMFSAVFLVVGGIICTVATGFFPLKKPWFILKHTVFSSKNGGVGDISPFAAMSMSLAATIGTGNIVGVATAISAGGPGAVFWMWISAFFGMSVKYAEILLSVYFSRKNEHIKYTAGAFSYIEKAYKSRVPALFFAGICLVSSLFLGGAIQVNSIAASLKNSFGVSRYVTGAVTALFVGLVIMGGIKSIASVAEKLVPTMALFYFAACSIVIIINAKQIPYSMLLIVKSAFTPSAAIGGAVGIGIKSAIQNGVLRGVFSNEAGLGTAPFAHTAAKTSHPAKQALWGIVEVFIDTFVICTGTALIIICSGSYKTGYTGAAMTIAAFKSLGADIAVFIVAISVVVFAFTTIISWSYYGTRCLEYLFGSSRFNNLYRFFAVTLIPFGAVAKINLIFSVADTTNSLMALINIGAVIVLVPLVIKIKDEFK